MQTVESEEQDASPGHPNTLSSWREGDEGIVLEVEGDTRFCVRLQELGVLPDARIRLLRAGCPTVIQIEDGRFCIRRADADAIRVRRNGSMGAKG